MLRTERPAANLQRDRRLGTRLTAGIGRLPGPRNRPGIRLLGRIPAVSLLGMDNYMNRIRLWAVPGFLLISFPGSWPPAQAAARSAKAVTPGEVQSGLRR